MHSRIRRRRWAAPSAAFFVLGMLAGCGQQGTPPEAPEARAHPVDEAAAHRGQVCPRKLPQASDESSGFGTSKPANFAPSLPVPESAWVCQYFPNDVGPGPDGDGTTLEWVRGGTARRIAESQLPALAVHLSELVPAERERACTADLGPRWMLAYAAGTDLTGVVVDAFGCQAIRLTDEPFHTAPGEATQPGTVPGVLTSSTGLLSGMQASHRRR
jgi:hypothetical protein